MRDILSCREIRTMHSCRCFAYSASGKRWPSGPPYCTRLPIRDSHAGVDCDIVGQRRIGYPAAALSFVLEDFLSFETGSRVHDRRAGVAAISIVIKLQIIHSRNLKNTTTTHSNSYSCHMSQVNICDGFSRSVGRDEKIKTLCHLRVAWHIENSQRF